MRIEIRLWRGRGLRQALPIRNRTRPITGSMVETAMYRIKQLFGRYLTLRDCNAQVGGEAMEIIRALNKMTRAGMPESVRIG